MNIEQSTKELLSFKYKKLSPECGLENISPHLLLKGIRTGNASLEMLVKKFTASLLVGAVNVSHEAEREIYHAMADLRQMNKQLADIAGRPTEFDEFNGGSSPDIAL